MYEKSIEEIPRLPFQAFVFGPIEGAQMCEAHFHNQVEILYGISGKCNVYVNEKSFVLSKGDLIFINPGEVHQITAYEPSSYAVFMFYTDILYTSSSDFFEIMYTLPIIMDHPAWQRFFSKEIIEKTFIPESMLDACREFKDKNHGFELAVKVHIYKVFLWIMRYYHSNNPDATEINRVSADDLSRLQIIFDYVEKNYQYEIGIEDAAKLCNLSYNYFSKFFKTVTSKNFTDYLAQVRIKAAEKLLTTTKQSITEIAQNVGFSTSSYFISQFKKQNNITPSNYRKNYVTSEIILP